MTMWIAFWHLFWRSLVYFPSELSANWLSVLLPCCIYLVREWFRFRKDGRRAMNWRVLERDTKILIGAYVLLFVWAVVHTVYQDHMALINRNVALESQLEFRQMHGLRLKIGGVVFTETDGGALIQLTVSALNEGGLVTAGDWHLTIRDGDYSFSTVFLPGSARLNGSPLLPEIEPLLSLPTQAREIAGLVTFVAPQLSQKKLEQMGLEPSAEMILSATDSYGKEVTAQQSLLELYRQRVGHFPANKGPI